MFANLCFIIAGLITGLIIIFGIIKMIKEKKFVVTKNIKNFFPLVFSYTFLFIPILNKDISFIYIFNCISKGIKALAFDFPISEIESIMAENIFFTTIIIINVFISLYLYSIVLIVFVFGKLINNLKGSLLKKKDHDILLDYDEKIVANYQKNYKNIIVWKKFSKDELSKIQKKYIISNHHFNEKNLVRYLKHCQKRVNIISFAKLDEDCLKILTCFLGAYNKNSTILNNVYLYLNCGYGNRYMFEKLIRNSKVASHVTIYNLHELIAQKFIFNQPMSKFLTSKEIDYSKGTIKKDLDIACVYVGFGKVNKELLTKQMSNNLFLHENNNLLEPHKINYHIIDINETIEDKNLNHYILRKDIKNDVINNRNKLYSIQFHNRCDINSSLFYENLSQMISLKENSVNHVIVSIGDDCENIDFSFKILDYLKSKNALGNNKIFCRVRDMAYLPIIQQNQDIVYFGEDSSVINHEVIFKKSIEEFGMKRNMKYYSVTNDNLSNETLNIWLKLPTVKRLNNIAVGLNTRHKLNLIGLDFVKKDQNVLGLSKEDYEKEYFESKIKASDLYNYNKYYHVTKIINKRNTLAYEEHLRWCAFFLSQGYDALPLDEIEYSYNAEKDAIEIKKEDLFTKKHACLMSFTDLDKYHQQNKKNLLLLAEKYNLDLSNKKYGYNGLIDTYQYDYQSMDDMFEFLDHSGYKIVKKDK